MWSKYHGGTSAAKLAEQYPKSIKMVNTSDIKDSSSEIVQVGDLYYDSDSNTFYYVSIITSSGSRPDSSSWVPLIQ